MALVHHGPVRHAISMSIASMSKVPPKQRKATEKSLKTISKALKAARIDQNLTQEELAELLGVSTEYVRRIENSQRIPSLPMLIRHSKALGLTLSVD